MNIIQRIKQKLKGWLGRTGVIHTNERQASNSLLKTHGDERAHKHVMELHGAICKIWDRGWQLSLADSTGQIPPHPTCMWSPNGDGRFNFSYQGSLFYTVDKHGVVECEQTPEEDNYNLDEVKSFFVLARMVLADISPEKTQACMTQATKELLGKTLGVMNAIN